jgi:3-deoxy-manno-octulosonate cytidylyltransferase (CMP-KDO synthetase)
LAWQESGVTDFGKNPNSPQKSREAGMSFRNPGPQSLESWLVVVPARLGSERLPRKPLQDLGGVPLVARVCRNLAPLVQAGATLRVATDSPEVVRACAAHGFTAVMTAPSHPSGTDRCHEAAQGLAHPYVLNVQGDEPFVDTGDLQALCTAMLQRPDTPMGTLAFAAQDAGAAKDPNVVKAAVSAAGYALYFSRSCIPFARDAAAAGHVPPRFWRHIGVYAFRREALAAFCALPPAELEQIEKLEQLRALANGWRIFVQPATRLTHGIDTPQDLEAARAHF